MSANAAIAAALRAAEASLATTKAALAAARREQVSHAAFIKLVKAERSAVSSVTALQEARQLLQSTRTTTAPNTTNLDLPKKQDPIVVKHQGTVAGSQGPGPTMGRQP